MELEAAAARMARRLAGGGVGPGDRLAAAADAGADFACLLHATPKLGAVLVPVPADGGERPPLGEEADAPLRGVVSPDAVHSVIHTSGTTGWPRPVELTYRNHHASAMAVAQSLGLEPGDRWLCCLPLHHVGGLAILIRSAIYGTTAILHRGFRAELVKEELESGRATLVSLVPTMLARLRDAGLRRAPALRALLLGGGPIPVELLDWAARRRLPVVPTYGMTETASSIAHGNPARSLPGVELRIAADGEILVRGPMVAPRALASDGWLHTGDLGRLDDSGRLHVKGRLKELIVTGGENVAPVEVEAALRSHPAVADAAVAGVADPEWGEAVTAFVVLGEDVAEEELIAWCRQRLAPFKVPKRVRHVDALPRNAAGKLLRDRLGRR